MSEIDLELPARRFYWGYVIAATLVLTVGLVGVIEWRQVSSTRAANENLRRELSGAVARADLAESELEQRRARLTATQTRLISCRLVIDTMSQSSQLASRASVNYLGGTVGELRTGVAQIDRAAQVLDDVRPDLRVCQRRPGGEQ